MWRSRAWTSKQTTCTASVVFKQQNRSRVKSTQNAIIFSSYFSNDFTMQQNYLYDSGVVFMPPFSVSKWWSTTFYYARFLEMNKSEWSIMRGRLTPYFGRSMHTAAWHQLTHLLVTSQLLCNAHLILLHITTHPFVSSSYYIYILITLHLV